MVVKKTRLFLDGFRHGFKSFGMIVTNIVNTVLLLLIYFVGVGFAALITRITSQKLMSVEKKKTNSYYKVNKTEKQNIEDFYKQY